MISIQAVKLKCNFFLDLLLKTLELQLFLMGLSLPILLGWGLPISLVAWFATPLFSPLFSLFLLCSTLVFFGYFFSLPNWPIVWVMEKICAVWLAILSWYKPWWLIGFCVPHPVILCVPLLGVGFIMHYKQYTHCWQRIWRMAVFIIVYCSLLKIYQYCQEPLIIKVPCNGSELTIISTHSKTICIDNGVLAKKPPNSAWIEYELLPAITKKTGKTCITHVICLQSSVRSLELISLLHKHSPLKTVMIPAYYQTGYSSYLATLKRLKGELFDKASGAIPLHIIKHHNILKVKINNQSALIVESSKEEVASKDKTFLLLQVNGTINGTIVHITALKCKNRTLQNYVKKGNSMNQALPVILIVAFDGYQQIEYLDTKKVLEQAGFTVKTASTVKGAAIAKDGSTCQVDLKIEEIDPKACAGVFVIGGPGALDDLNSLKMHAVLQKVVNAGKPCGAICISTRILAQAGVLDNKKATGWDDDHKLADIYQAHHITYVKNPVVIDGNIITAEGPDAAKGFGEGIVSIIGK